jgi:hypothetical protein
LSQTARLSFWASSLRLDNEALAEGDKPLPLPRQLATLETHVSGSVLLSPVIEE